MGQFIGEGMKAPAWFEKELKMIDPRYFLYWNEYYGYWEIKCRMIFDRTVEIGVDGAWSDGTNHGITEKQVIRSRAENPTIAIHHVLNDGALIALRRRKYLRLKYKHDEDELKEIEEMNREATEKASRMGVEMIADGLIKMDKLENKRSQVYDMATQGGA
jgi:hypothetical protein